MLLVRATMLARRDQANAGTLTEPPAGDFLHTVDLNNALSGFSLRGPSGIPARYTIPVGNPPGLTARRRGSQVRNGLAGGGSRIRTSGPSINPARPVLTPDAMRGIFVMFVFDAHLA